MPSIRKTQVPAWIECGGKISSTAVDVTQWAVVAIACRFDVTFLLVKSDEEFLKLEQTDSG